MLKPFIYILTVIILMINNLDTADAQNNPKAQTPPLRWIDLKDQPLEGRGWVKEAATPYDRLPARAKDKVRPDVWTLSQDSTGMLLRFSTNSKNLYVRWSLRKPNRISMGHMPTTGVSGVDLYAKDGDSWRYVSGAGRHVRSSPNENEASLFVRRPGDTREYLLHLPLYNGVESMQIGIDPNASFNVIRREDKPVVFYGTSITQGGCASRPGMAYPSILGRRLDVQTINLGFSGNALTEPEIADLLAELDPAVYMLNPLPNLQPAEVYPRLKHMIATIRNKHPQTPIILVESITYGGSWFNAQPARRANNSNAELKKLFAELSPRDANLHYIDGAGLLGDDHEATVDGSHPTDMGFMRMADHIEPTLRKALGQ